MKKCKTYDNISKVQEKRKNGEKSCYSLDQKTGFSYCVIPKSNAKNIEGKFKIDIIEAENLTDIMKQICE